MKIVRLEEDIDLPKVLNLLKKHGKIISRVQQTVLMDEVDEEIEKVEGVLSVSEQQKTMPC